MPLDVRVYINKSGKVDYAELLSDITASNRDFATLAVFNARHWEFQPARSGIRIVPGRAILHYRFGNPGCLPRFLAIRSEPSRQCAVLVCAFTGCSLPVHGEFQIAFKKTSLPLPSVTLLLL